MIIFYSDEIMIYLKYKILLYTPYMQNNQINNGFFFVFKNQYSLLICNEFVTNFKKKSSQIRYKLATELRRILKGKNCCKFVVN